MVLFKCLTTVSCSSSIITMALYCIISEIKRHIGRTSRLFHTPLAFDASVRVVPSDYCHNSWCRKTRIMWIPSGENSLRILLSHDPDPRAAKSNMSPLVFAKWRVNRLLIQTSLKVLSLLRPIVQWHIKNSKKYYLVTSSPPYRLHCAVDVSSPPYRLHCAVDVSSPYRLHCAVDVRCLNVFLSLKWLNVIRIFTVEWGVCKFLLVLHCNYGLILYRFQDKAWYWSKIAFFYRASAYWRAILI